MSCDIVKNWVGNMDNAFYVCKDHKIECPDEHTCPGVKPAPIDLVEVSSTTPPLLLQHDWNMIREECERCGMTYEMYYAGGSSQCLGPSIEIRQRRLAKP